MSGICFLICTAATLAALLFSSLAWVLFGAKPHAPAPRKVCIVLGSGGHTSEMMQVLRALPDTHWANNNRFYIISATDRHSAALADAFEESCSHGAARVHIVPRAREVGQSYWTSVWSTLRALCSACRIVATERPDVILMNGPGVCVPVALAAVLMAACMPWSYRRGYFIYMESFTCVRHLSLSGRLLAWCLADVFTYHWLTLQPRVAAVQHRGEAYCVGPTPAELEHAPALPATVVPPASSQTRSELSPRSSAARFAVVTVGSTHFDGLVLSACTPRVMAALHAQLGVTKVYMQYGAASPAVVASALGDAARSDDVPDGAAVLRTSIADVAVEAFRYRANLSEYIRAATVVISHAGAGTVLECLAARRPLVVVVNETLMGNHQLELATALADHHFLFCVPAAELAQRVAHLNFTTLRAYPGMACAAVADALSLPLTGVVAKARQRS